MSHYGISCWRFVRYISLCMIASLVICFSFDISPAYAKKEAELDPGLVNPGYHEIPDWFKGSFLDIREDVDEASKNGKRVMLYFYQDGCPYCKKLITANFGQRLIADKTRKYFDVIAINMWGDREAFDFQGKATTEKAFAVQQKVMFTPTLLLLDEHYNTVLRISGYFSPNKFMAALDYVGTHQETKGSFREYLHKNIAQPSMGNLHQDPTYIPPPYRFADLLNKSARPLLVMFEQRQCIECDELHQDILKRQKSEALLRKFHVALLDMWSSAPVQTPGGIDTTISQWVRDLTIQSAPSMVFFDPDGKEVFRTEAYLKAFHIQSAMDYVLSGAYASQPEFQRYIDKRAEHLLEQGVQFEVMD